jgi:hypothetical protein
MVNSREHIRTKSHSYPISTRVPLFRASESTPVQAMDDVFNNFSDWTSFAQFGHIFNQKQKEVLARASFLQELRALGGKHLDGDRDPKRQETMEGESCIPR